MRESDFFGAKYETPHVLLSLMLNQRQDYWSRRTTADTTFRIFMFLLSILPFFLPLTDRPFQRQAISDYVFVFTSLIIVLLWYVAQFSLDSSIRKIEIELFRLAEETGQLADGFIRSKDMYYPGLINRLKLLSVLEPALWVSVIIHVFLLRHFKGI